MNRFASCMKSDFGNGHKKSRLHTGSRPVRMKSGSFCADESRNHPDQITEGAWSLTSVLIRNSNAVTLINLYLENSIFVSKYQLLKIFFSDFYFTLTIIKKTAITCIRTTLLSTTVDSNKPSSHHFYSLASCVAPSPLHSLTSPCFISSLPSPSSLQYVHQYHFSHLRH